MEAERLGITGKKGAGYFWEANRLISLGRLRNSLGARPEKPYPVAEEHPGRVPGVAMPRAVRSAPFLTRYHPPRGRRRIIQRLQEFEHSEAQRGVRYVAHPVPQTTSAQQEKGERDDGATHIRLLS